MTEKVRRSSAPTEGNDEIDIGRLFGTVLEARWWVIGITGLFAVLAAVYALFATPVYKADALVQIEQNAGNTLVNDISSALSNKPPASAAEIQLIQSRMVLGKTVDDLNLDISVTKNTFWLFGAGWDHAGAPERHGECHHVYAAGGDEQRHLYRGSAERQTVSTDQRRWL